MPGRRSGRGDGGELEVGLQRNECRNPHSILEGVRPTAQRRCPRPEIHTHSTKLPKRKQKVQFSFSFNLTLVLTPLSLREQQLLSPCGWSRQSLLVDQPEIWPLKEVQECSVGWCLRGEL